MKRLLAVLLGFFGLRALLRRRRPAPAPVSPADDLREKLAETRDAEAEAEPPEVDDRRADVHARARQAIDDLRDGVE